MGNNNPETTNLENEKLRLEISQLRGQLGGWYIFKDKYGPALIAAIVLFALVPLANYILWKNQKQIEVRNIYLTKKMELYAESAANATRFSQLISVINKCYKVKQKPKKNVKIDAALAKLKIEDLEKERLEVEARLIKTLREVRLYFSPDVSIPIDNIRELYNKSKGPLDEKFVQEFLNLHEQLQKIMGTEIRNDLDKN